MSFKVIGKGSTVQENLLPGTVKEMATMYHCNEFKNCSQLKAKHYCAKQNQPELIFDSAGSSERVISITCDMKSSLCNSGEGHVHKITHELSQDSNQNKGQPLNYPHNQAVYRSFVTFFFVFCHA